MNTDRYFFDDGDSRKFWTCSQRGKKQTISHGRIGTAGRETIKTFPTPSEAKENTAKLVEQKLKKGYNKVAPENLKITRPKGTRKATEAQVLKLEKHIGSKLPSEYRNFLLTQNGGLSDPNYVEIPEMAHIEAVDVGYIFGIYPLTRPEFTACIYRFGQDIKGVGLPEGHLPIAGSGDAYSISLLEKRGCVYFWDHEGPNSYEDEDEDGNVIFNMSHASLLAGTFNEFLTRISLFVVDDYLE